MDANGFIIDQTIALDQAMQQDGADTGLVPRSFAIHSWSTLDNTAVLDWLQPHRLTRPAAGEVLRTIADRDGAWHDLDIKQSSADALTPILWTVQPQANAFYAIETENLAELAIDAAEIGLNTGGLMRVIFQAKDTSPTNIVLRGIDQMPASVVRRGVSGSSWSYDAATGTLTLHELGGSAGWGAWIIQP